VSEEYAIFDLDGCISDDRHRRHLLPSGPEGTNRQSAFDDYHGRLHSDDFVNREFVRKHMLAGRRLVFITARPRSYDGPTRCWLSIALGSLKDDAGNDMKVGVHYQVTLLMRPDGNSAPSPALKVELFGRWLEDRGEWCLTHEPHFMAKSVVAAYDDRKDVLAAYSWHGVENTNLLRVEDAVENRELTAEPADADPEEVEASFRTSVAEPYIPPSTEKLEKIVQSLSESDLVNSSELVDVRRAVEEAIHREKSRLEKSEGNFSSVPELLRTMAATYEERNAGYKDNFRKVGPVMRALFPEGAPRELLGSDHFHLFELLVVKMTRFANSGMTQRDSIHDAAVYCAMIESALAESDS